MHYYSPPLIFNSYGAWRFSVLFKNKTERLSGDTPKFSKEIEVPMKDGIHPNYVEFKATCSCGNVVVTRSTANKDIYLDVCSACHPFYTGKQKAAETGGRVDKFNKRFGALSKK